MYVTPEQIAVANKASIESILSLATSQFATFERLANLNANAVKAIFEDSLANIRALSGAKDMQEFVNLQSALAQPAFEKAIAYSKSVYEVSTQASAELVKTSEARAADWNQNLVSMLDKAAKSAPGGSDVAVSAVKQMITAANSVYDSFTKAAKQATEIAEANVAAVTETVKGARQSKKAA